MRLLALSLITVIFLAGCASQYPTTTQTNQPTPSPTVQSSGLTYQINITPAGFLPTTLNIKSGDTVKFVNRDTAQHWPASDPHPTHNGYPETGGCIGSKFDACHPLNQGDTFSFTFTYVGNWCYHDHLQTTKRGCINVQ